MHTWRNKSQKTQNTKPKTENNRSSRSGWNKKLSTRKAAGNKQRKQNKSSQISKKEAGRNHHCNHHQQRVKGPGSGGVVMKGVGDLGGRPAGRAGKKQQQQERNSGQPQSWHSLSVGVSVCVCICVGGSWPKDERGEEWAEALCRSHLRLGPLPTEY